MDRLAPDTILKGRKVFSCSLTGRVQQELSGKLFRVVTDDEANHEHRMINISALGDPDKILHLHICNFDVLYDANESATQ